MPIPVSCSSCKQSFYVGDENAGMSGLCFQCGAIIHVPSQEQAAVNSVGQADAMSEQPFASQDGSTSYVARLSSATEMPKTLCVKCNKPVLVGSVKCYFCEAPVDDGFDAYQIWLGIPKEEQPPTHYRLLGLHNFEQDAGLIENAADHQMQVVRQHHLGKHMNLSQRVLNEIASAKICLLNPTKKTAYDQMLSKIRQSIVPPVAAHVAVQAQPNVHQQQYPPVHGQAPMGSIPAYSSDQQVRNSYLPQAVAQASVMPQQLMYRATPETSAVESLNKFKTKQSPKPMLIGIGIAVALVGGVIYYLSMQNY